MFARHFRELVAAAALLIGGGCGPTEYKLDLTTSPARRSFLKRRAPDRLICGKFYQFSNFLLAMQSVPIATDSERVAMEALGSPFPKTYKPTWREVFNAVGRQTKSTWRWDSKYKGWVFSPPGPPRTFFLKAAKGWTVQDHGDTISYVPPAGKGGMDVCMYGTYTHDRNIPHFFEWVRNALAYRFAHRVRTGITLSDMKQVQVDGAEAIFFEAPAHKKDMVWRQWAFIRSGHAFLILSALSKADEKTLLPALNAMVKSFRFRPPTGRRGSAS